MRFPLTVAGVLLSGTSTVVALDIDYSPERDAELKACDVYSYTGERSEAELCYGALCFVTDYDVWHEEEADVSADLILKNLLHNVESGRAIISATVAALPQQRDCDCGDALASALVTAPNFVPAETRQRLDLLLRRYRGPADGGGS